jgi:RNA polymerase sigma-70 factor (ECF subfamily)
MRTAIRFETTSPPMDDSQLAFRARADADAFAELYRRHVTHVYRYHLVHTGNVKDAEDLTSQTFMAALEGIRSYRSAGSFAAWIMGIAMRKRLMFFRGRSRLDLPLDVALTIPDPSPSTDDTAGRRLHLDQLHAALRSLEPDRQEAIALCFFAGLAYREAARVLGRSEAAFKMLLSRALHDLRTRTSLALEVQND